MLLLPVVLSTIFPCPSVTCTDPPPVTAEKPTTDRQIIRLIARVMAGRISPSHFPFLHSQT